MDCQREDVEFHSDTAICRAWLYKAMDSGAGPRPCIVMAPGLGGTRDAGLEPYAQKFAKAGYEVLVFDYRHFGSSEGEPRQLFSVNRQLQDWANAIQYARGLKGVDAKRIALWGTSFSGGHVIVAAVKDGDIAAVSAQCPMMDALAALRAHARNAGFVAFMKLGMLGMLDQLGAMFRMPPVYVPLVAAPRELAVMCSPDSVPGYGAITPPLWRNQICARFAVTVNGYRPITFASRLSCPALIQVCTGDRLLPPAVTIKAARKIGAKAQLTQYDCSHFDIYVGKQYERASNEQIDFFDHVLSPDRSES